MHQNRKRCSRMALLQSLGAGLIIAALASGAVAQVKVQALPDSVLRPYSVRHAAAAPVVAAPLPSAAPTAPAAALQLRDYSWLGGAVQVEASRTNIDGTYKRPKVIVGLPSESMKSWLNSAGFPTEQCLLPMVRARARINNEGEASGAFWLYARCTFQ
jgi:hypothetical protein